MRGNGSGTSLFRATSSKDSPESTDSWRIGRNSAHVFLPISSTMRSGQRCEVDSDAVDSDAVDSDAKWRPASVGKAMGT